MIYLYGLLDQPLLEDSALTNLTGLQNSPQAVSIGDRTLIYENHDGSEIQPRRRLMLQHTRVLEHLMRFGTVLPARFGLVATALDVVKKLINDKSTEIAAEFKKLQGCVELGVRISFSRDAALAATLIADPVLQARRTRLMGLGPEAHFARAEFGQALADSMDRRRGAAQKSLLVGLKPFLRDFVLRSPDSDVEVLRLETLIAASEEAEIIKEIEKLARECAFAPASEPHIQIIGPAPAYNFVRLSLAVDADPARAA